MIKTVIEQIDAMAEQRERMNLNDTFDRMVEHVIETAASGQDFMQDAISIAQSITDIDTRMRFNVGDIASLIETVYSHDDMGTFAGACKRSKKTCYQYAAMAKFYPREERASWLAEPALSWSHLRLAMRLKNADDAAAFLEHCANETLSVDGASIELAERMGQSVKPAALFNETAVLMHVNGEWVIRAEGIHYCAIQDGQSYQVTIKSI